MKKIVFACILAALEFIALSSFGQSKASINGYVKDSLGRKALQYATVELYRASAPGQAFRSVYTNEKGQFHFNALDTGTYKLVISHTGFSEVQRTILVSGITEAGDFMLGAAAGTLKGVTVQARKPLVEQTDDKVVFNVENDPATKTENAIDILRKTPFVTVDGDNNVQVNGQSNFKVLLNGRETAMFSQNVKDALKAFPGALIVKIEVITTPSAKYDAEGVGGIINIITKKKVAGYNGSVSIYYTNTGWYNLNTNFSAKFNKVGITLNYGNNFSNNILGHSKMETVPFVPAYFTKRTLLGSRLLSNFWNWGNAEASVELDSLNTLSFYSNVNGGTNRSVLDQSITTNYPTVPDSVSHYNLDMRSGYPTLSVGSDYIKKFAGNSEKEFSIRFNTEFSNGDNYLNSFMDNPVAADRYVINDSKARNIQYTLQSDYIYPLSKNQKIEAGVKAIMRRATSDFTSEIRTSASEDYKVSTDNTDHFQYDQNVYSVYGSYGFKVSKTSFRLGARMEHTDVAGDFVTSKTIVNQSYTNLMPNIQATTKFSNIFTLVLSYTDRLQRPFIYNLNPFKNNNDPYNVSFGNPDLQPQIIHTVSLQTRYSKNGTFAGITFAGSYSNNMIVQYASFDANTGVTSTTSGNYGEETQMSINANVSTKINDKWNVFLNGNIRFSRVRNKLLPTQTNTGYGGNANLNTSYSISKRFTTSGYAGFFRQPPTIQTSYPLNVWYGISLGYKFFNEKLTTSFGAANFLQKDRDWQLLTKDPLFQYTSTTTMPFRALSLSVSWSFGKLTENVSKKKGVTNDDLIGNGQGSGN
jgi:outer membrane receptor protein involved in Fe transport